MGKSYKKTPIVKDSGPSYRRAAKREANRRVRRAKHVPNGKQYRKFYNPWDIYDDVCRYSIHQHLADYEAKLNEFYNGGLWYDKNASEEGIHKEYSLNGYIKSMYRK